MSVCVSTQTSRLDLKLTCFLGYPTRARTKPLKLSSTEPEPEHFHKEKVWVGQIKYYHHKRMLDLSESSTFNNFKINASIFSQKSINFQQIFNNALKLY